MQGVKSASRFAFFASGCPVVPASFFEKTILSPLNYFCSFVKISWFCLCKSREFSWVYEWPRKWITPKDTRHSSIFVSFDHLKSFYQHFALHIPMILKCSGVKGEFSYAYFSRRVWTVVLEKTLESPLDCKEIQPVHPKGDQSWVFIARTDVEAGTPILWPPHEKSWLTGKDPDAGRDRGQEEKGTTEDEMAEWHHQLDGHEFE